MIYYLKHNLHKLNWAMIGNVLGMVLIAQACLMVLPVIVDLIYQEGLYDSYLIVIGICLVLGYALTRTRAKVNNYFAKDGMIAVGLAWIVVSFFGGLPFYLSGEIPSFVDCFFEAVSGFTTTGSSILTEVESLKHATLFWRSFTHWIGGMGILVFVIAFIPIASGRSMHILKAEVPGPVVGKLVSKVRATARILYVIYAALTVIEIVLLLFGGMPLFDSILNAFGTAGTGGFAIKNASIAAYHSAYFDVVITIFMILFGINFNAYYLLLTKKVMQAAKNEEVRYYLGIIGLAIVAIAINTREMFTSFGSAFQQAAFQVGSIITTTGYATTDFNVWPVFSKTILVILMFVGACAGSTGGGIKVSRLLILCKSARKELQLYLHPNAVKKIKMDDKAIPHEVVRATNMFLFVYIMIFVTSLLIISLDNLDMVSNFTAIAATLNNIGPGLGAVGPTGNFDTYSYISKAVMIFDMLAGRLEIFPLLILFVRDTWKKF